MVSLSKEQKHSHLPDMKVRPLTNRQKIAMQMTLDGCRKGEICEHLGITPRTFWNWKQLPGWQATVEVLLKVEGSDGDGMVKTFYPQAVSILRQLALTGSDGIKLGAARSLLEVHANLVQREEQLQMITHLEEQLHDVQAMAVSHQEALAIGPAIDAEVSMPHDSPHGEPLSVEIAE